MVKIVEEMVMVTLARNNSLKQWYRHHHLCRCPQCRGGGGSDHGNRGGSWRTGIVLRMKCTKKLNEPFKVTLALNDSL